MANPKTAPTIPTKPPDDKAPLDDLLNRLEKERGHPVIVYWTTPLARISLAADIPLFDQLRALKQSPELDLVLYTEAPPVFLDTD